MKAAVFALGLALAASSRSAHAHCSVPGDKAADVDLAYWNGLGLSLPTPRPAFSLGFEATFQAYCYGGYPAGSGLSEVRAGPWIVGETTLDGARVEGGLKIHAGAIGHARWGTHDLRLGGGYGMLDDVRRPFATLTAGWGARAAIGRGKRVTWDPGSPSFELVRPVRIFGTLRCAVDAPFCGAFQLVFGLEITPALALPPQSAWQLIGEND